MRKILVFGLMVVMMFLLGLDVVVAADLPGDPPGGGGIIAPQPPDSGGGATISPPPIPTDSAPTPTYPPGVSVPWCLKCNKDIPGRDPFISTGKIDYNPLSHSTTWQGGPTEKYYRDKNWFCPNVWTAWNSIDGLIDEMKKVYASNSKIWREMSAFMHACQGDQVICADKSNPSNSNTCKSLKCDIFGVCDWDGEINNCCANTIDLEADCKSVLFAGQAECEMRYGTCHVDEYACKYGGGSVGSEPEPTEPEPEPTESPSLTEFWVRDENFVGRKRCCDFNSFGLCTEEEYRSNNRDKNKFLCQNCENEDEETEDAFCFRSHKFCEWDDYISKLVKALPIWISNCGTTYPVYGGGGFSGYMSNQDSCRDDWLGIHMDMWSCKTQTGSNARCICDSAKPFSSPPSLGNCCVDKCGMPGIYWDDSDSFGCCWSWESANRTPSDEIYGICGGKAYYSCDESEGVYQCNKFTHDTTVPPVPDCLDEGTCFETLTGCQENCGRGMSILPPVQIYPKDKSEVETIDGRNHICEIDFRDENDNPIRVVDFKVRVANTEGAENIHAVSFSLNSHNYNNILTSTVVGLDTGSFLAFPTFGDGSSDVGVTIMTTSGVLPEGMPREVTFRVDFYDTFDIKDLMFVWFSAMDKQGKTMPWTSAERSFKVWDCKVPVSGAMYDGTVEEGGDVCIDGFSEKVEADFYDSLTFRRLGNNPEDFEMTVNSPDYESDGNSLDWGFSYNHLFGNLDGDSENILLKVTDVGGSSSCDALLNLGTRVDPYSTLPSAVVDFALAVNPDPWFQSIDGGVQAGGNFTNTVPVTCASNPDCVEASVISGLLAAGGSMNKGCSDCSFASPDTWVNKNMVTGSFAYQYFYNEYFAKLGQGTTMSGESTMTDLGEEAKGIYFIDGDFFVDKNNTLTTASSDYLIIIAKGRIIFEEDVDVSSGIFIADGDIEARGEGSSNLTIEGMLFSTNGNVRLSRGYINRSMNRSNPGVLVLFRPDYLFKLPGEITRVLSGWRER